MPCGGWWRPCRRRVGTTSRARFADREQRLRDAGLADAFLQRVDALGADAARALAHATCFKLGLACPFLDEDACSIHPQRPFVCRQYLVTSDPALCADPFALKARCHPDAAARRHRGTGDQRGRLWPPQHWRAAGAGIGACKAASPELERRFDAGPLFRQWLGRWPADGRGQRPCRQHRPVRAPVFAVAPASQR